MTPREIGSLATVELVMAIEESFGAETPARLESSKTRENWWIA